MRIGVMVNNLEPDRLKAFAVAAGLGFQVIHTNAISESWLRGPEREQYIAAARSSGLTIASMFVGFDGQSYADFPTIARTVGLVIPELREHRCRVVRAYSDLAHDLGVESLSGHLGFAPFRNHPDYPPLVQALRGILDFCAERGQAYHLETGQESADDLLQLIMDVERPNLWVNFDPANFILYGTDNPLRALEILGPWVRGFHCKDAVGSGEPNVLGRDVPLGQGAVDFPVVLRRLEKLGYDGPLIIEREAGDDRVADILAARQYLSRLLG